MTDLPLVFCVVGTGAMVDLSRPVVVLLVLGLLFVIVFLWLVSFYSVAVTNISVQFNLIYAWAYTLNR